MGSLRHITVDVEHAAGQRRSRLPRVLDSVAAALESRSAIAVLLLTICYVPMVLMEAHGRLLSADELYTLHIAQAPTIRSMLHLARETDLHPPLSYVLERCALRLPGPRWLVARLPNLLCGLLATAMLFQFASRRMGRLYGYVTVAVLWFSPAIEFAWQNRSYMVWMALLTVLMVLWGRTLERQRRVGPGLLLGVAATTALMVTTHIFGVACVAAFLLGEAVWWRRRGTVRWSVLAALLLPCLLAMWSATQVSGFGQWVSPPAYRASLGALVNTYSKAVTDLFVVAAICGAVALFARQDLPGPSPATVRARGLGWEEMGMLAGLLCLPAVLVGASAAHHSQVFARYGLSAVPALAALVPWCASRVFPRPRLWATLMVLAMVGNCLARGLTDGTPGGTEVLPVDTTGTTQLTLRSLRPDLPIVAASPLTYMEMNDREPAELAERTRYLTDAAAALHYSHSTLFSNEAKISDLFGLRGRAVPVEEFARQTPCFYVVGSSSMPNPEDWLLRMLVDRHAAIEWVGVLNGTYRESEVFLVSWDAAPLRRPDRCGTHRP